MATQAATPGTIETVTLTNGEFDNDGEARSLRALLFGAMLDRAESVVKHYRSDLFHDALWIEKYVASEMAWFWMVRTYGTHIGTDLGAAYTTWGKDADNVTYKVTLTKTRISWQVSFEVMPTDLPVTTALDVS